MAKRKAAAETLELPVQYGNCSIGDKTASIGVKIDRSRITLPQADKHLCGRRLTGTLYAAAHQDTKAGQGEMFDQPRELEGSFDVDSFSVTEKTVKATLSFKVKGLDHENFNNFAKRSGRVKIDKVESVGPADDEEEEEEE